MFVCALDFEFYAVGDVPEVVSLTTVCSDGQEKKYWWEELYMMTTPPPEVVDADAIITFFGTAELGCFIALGWDFPTVVLDMYVHAKQQMNIDISKTRASDNKVGLYDALDYFNIRYGDKEKKDKMRDYIMSALPDYSEQGKQDILEYNLQDSQDTLKIFLAEQDKFKGAYLTRMVYYGHYLKAIAWMEHRGIPLDIDLMNILIHEGWKIKELILQKYKPKYTFLERKPSIYPSRLKIWLESKHIHWWHTTKSGFVVNNKAFKICKNKDPDLYNELYPIYIMVTRGEHEKLVPLQSKYPFIKLYDINREEGAKFVARHGLQNIWKRTEKGELSFSKDAFKDAARVKGFEDIENVATMVMTVDFTQLPVGKDGRTRTLLSPFGTKTSRHNASTNRFVFGLPKWSRLLVKAPKGKAVIEIDYKSQEFGVAAYLSNDDNMIKAYESGDPYQAFADLVGHISRNVSKTSCLGIQYNMGADSLAVRLQEDRAFAQARLNDHKTHFAKYWSYSDNYVTNAYNGTARTACGWEISPIPSEVSPRTLSNFPIQGTGADILREAVRQLHIRGFPMIATIHDAIIFEFDDDDTLQERISEAEIIMQDASATVLPRGRIITEVETTRQNEHWKTKVDRKFWLDFLPAFDTSNIITTLTEELSNNEDV